MSQRLTGGTKTSTFFLTAENTKPNGAVWLSDHVPVVALLPDFGSDGSSLLKIWHGSTIMAVDAERVARPSRGCCSPV
ncbi:hypothetical protein NKH63_26275 [Mesorhizobium sp. M0960]|uniref:hypothetical protein n=1 Tax=Mesorhizobium sp. M0960 TaxID=2957035 RepID=UPI003339ACFA